MNTDETRNKDNLPSSSQVSNPDTNANLRLTIDESKGAIPKTKLTKVTPKRTNNNIGDASLMHIDSLKINGFTKSSSSSTFINKNLECSSGNSYIVKSNHTNNLFKRGSLNIPLEGDFINGKSIKHSSAFDSLNETCVNFQDQNSKDDSSSDDNELLSLSDDGCIYTYKGDHVADLPSSFYNLEIPPLDEAPAEAREGKYISSCQVNKINIHYLSRKLQSGNGLFRNGFRPRSFR